MKIGIPRAMFNYLNGDITIDFFKNLGVDVVLSPKTTKKIIESGMKFAPDEMCLSMKNYIGHVSCLVDNCDYLLVPRIDNYHTFNQTCTNFLATRDIINDMFDIKVLDYNIDLNNKDTMKKGLFKVAGILGFKVSDISNSYKNAVTKHNAMMKKLINKNISKLNGNKKKVLLISHSYNTYDELIGRPIIKLLEKEGFDIIYSDLLDKSMCRKLSKNISKELYWKYSREGIGAYEMVKNRIDGVVFLSTFPCGLDSLVNELLILKMDKPHLNIVIDDYSADNGLETRIESFADIIKETV